VIEYGITLKVSKSKYKVRYYFMGSNMIIQFLYFHTDCSTVFKNENVGKIKKTLKLVL